MSNNTTPAFDAQLETRVPVERGSNLPESEAFGAGNGTGDSIDRATEPDCGEEVGNDDRTARATLVSLSCSAV